MDLLKIIVALVLILHFYMKILAKLVHLTLIETLILMFAKTALNIVMSAPMKQNILVPNARQITF